jgi:hypothetical protein
MSSFRLNADMGQLSAIVIFIALVVDFLFLPTLLMLFDKEAYAQNKTINNPDTDSQKSVTATQL